MKSTNIETKTKSLSSMLKLMEKSKKMSNGELGFMMCCKEFFEQPSKINFLEAVHELTYLYTNGQIDSRTFVFLLSSLQVHGECNL